MTTETTEIGGDATVTVGLGLCQPLAEETRPRYCLRGTEKLMTNSMEQDETLI